MSSSDKIEELHIKLTELYEERLDLEQLYSNEQITFAEYDDLMLTNAIVRNVLLHEIEQLKAGN